MFIIDDVNVSELGVQIITVQNVIQQPRMNVPMSPRHRQQEKWLRSQVPELDGLTLVQVDYDNYHNQYSFKHVN